MCYALRLHMSAAPPRVGLTQALGPTVASSRLQRMASETQSSKCPVDSQSRPDIRGEGQLLQAMLAHWIHEDQLYWTQIRHLLVLQLAVFASWFALGLTWLAVLVTTAAAVIFLLIYRLARVIAKNRDSNVKAIEHVSRNMASSETLAALEGYVFRFATHEFRGWADKGRSFQAVVFWICLSANIGLAAVTAFDLAGYKTILPQLHPKFSASKANGP